MNPALIWKTASHQQRELAAASNKLNVTAWKHLVRDGGHGSSLSSICKQCKSQHWISKAVCTQTSIAKFLPYQKEIWHNPVFCSTQRYSLRLLQTLVRLNGSPDSEGVCLVLQAQTVASTKPPAACVTRGYKLAHQVSSSFLDSPNIQLQARQSQRVIDLPF